MYRCVITANPSYPAKCPKFALHGRHLRPHDALPLPLPRSGRRPSHNLPCPLGPPFTPGCPPTRFLSYTRDRTLSSLPRALNSRLSIFVCTATSIPTMSECAFGGASLFCHDHAHSDNLELSVVHNVCSPLSFSPACVPPSLYCIHTSHPSFLPPPHPLISLPFKHCFQLAASASRTTSLTWTKRPRPWRPTGPQFCSTQEAWATSSE